MPKNYRVRIEKERHVFSAAHFITYNGDMCEPLHGHNYHVAAEVRGPLDENQYVIDFVAIGDALQQILQQLDHRMLLPTGHPTIVVSAEDNEVEVSHGQRRWVFPRQDCVLLPVANTTAELLARHIGRLLCTALQERTGARPAYLSVEVDECDGQWGICEFPENGDI
tara:strand:- start:37 stop:537 length:501 start_codon:yes stop_codon:yes gene_type:complete